LKAVLAMADGLADEVFPAGLRDRLRRTVTLVDRPAQAQLLITGWGAPVLDAAYLAGAPALRAVFHTGGSVKRLVTGAAFGRGIVVSSAARANARPVAEFTVATIVLAAKRAFVLARPRAGAGTSTATDTPAPYGLCGTTIGIVGASHVGRAVLDRLRGYDARLLLHDPYLSAEQARSLGAHLVDLDRLCRDSDIVSLHAPELPETHHLLDARRLGLLHDGAIVVNTARGGLLDHAALAAQCAAGRLDAVLDVTDPWPLPPGHPLWAMPNVFLTPHIAGSQGSELRRLGEFALAEIERYVAGAPLAGLVRAEDLARVA
jgi:phosphoglycerate dehydrogenase-like enzyme